MPAYADRDDVEFSAEIFLLGVPVLLFRWESRSGLHDGALVDER
jgi:hypothetical protein